MAADAAFTSEGGFLGANSRIASFQSLAKKGRRRPLINTGAASFRRGLGGSKAD